MYLAVDIGGTKTLLACFDDKGKLLDTIKFPTPTKYDDFLTDLKHYLQFIKIVNFQAAGVAVPGKLDRKHGRALAYGNLVWPVVPIEADVEKIVACPVVIENDSKLAGLSEALLIKKEFKNVLYITIGTGISSGLITNGIIDPAMQDSEGGQMWLDHKGKRMQWEDIVSGKAIVRRFGKRASQIEDQATWQRIADDIAQGLIQLIVVIQPEVIVLGGGVVTNFNEFIGLLQKSLKRYEMPLTPIPPIRKAQRPEEAVIYGAFELARQRFGHESKKKPLRQAQSKPAKKQIAKQKS
ncbi:MAG TPA: ROK family protein [Candidatus Saccharimonadales bacterium]|nr:ROK family protein [Candidatus Saccharimonadales bacterium]